MKIGIYAPAKNEIKHVEDWVKSCELADVIVVADTGSTDGTKEKLIELGVRVTDLRIVPWRFDDAFNSAMYLLPDDIDVCIRLDLDERLQPGWREHLEKAWTSTTTRLRYTYVWSWNSDGTPQKQWDGDRIHSRKGYRWRGATHEALYSRGPEVQTYCRDLKIFQFPDPKSKSHDLSLLQESLREYPQDARIRSYLAREYFYHGNWATCIEECEKYLKMETATWNVERAAVFMYMATSYRGLNKNDEAQKAATKSTLECPEIRETWLELARSANKNGDYYTGYYAATKCLSIKELTNYYISDSSAYGYEPYDQAAIASYYIGKYVEAIEFGTKAIELCPGALHLERNLQYYLSKI